MNTQLSHSATKTQPGPRSRVRLSKQRSRSARSIMIILAVCLALQMTSFVMILPLFSRRFIDFGAGIEALGISAMAYALTSTIAAPFMGALADRFGRRPLVLGSLAVYVLAFSGYLLASSASTFILLRGMAGALTAGVVPAVMGIVADLAPGDRRAQWIGIVSGGASIGWIIGPLLGGILYDHWGYVLPFGVSIGMAVLTFWVAFFTVPETRSISAASPGDHSSPPATLGAASQTLRDWLPQPTILFTMLLTISFMVMFAWAFVDPQLMFYAYDQLGWTSSQLGLAMSAYGVAMMLGEFALGRSSDRYGRKPVLIVGLAFFTAQFAGLALFRAVAPIAVSFILAGLGNALFDPALSAYILDITPPEHKARVMGMKSTAGSLGSVLGPALVVLFTPYLPPRGVFLIAAAMVVLVTLASLWVLRKPSVSGPIECHQGVGELSLG